MSRITNATSQIYSCSSCAWLRSGIFDVGQSNHDICIVEGSGKEKSLDLRTKEMSKSVWRSVKPPCNFDMYQPIISARRTEIVRTQLNRKSKSLHKNVAIPKSKTTICGDKDVTSNSMGAKFSKQF